MKICPCCGQLLAEDIQFCTACGCPLTEAAAAERFAAEAEAAPEPPQPEAAPQQPSGPYYAPVLPQQPDGGLTTAQYFWTMVLFAIPVVGLVFMLYWSFGSTCSPAKRRFARASLIKTGIMAAIFSIALAVFSFFAAAAFSQLRDVWNSRSYWGDYYDDWDDYGDYGDYYGGYGDRWDDYGDYFDRGDDWGYRDRDTFDEFFGGFFGS